MARLVCSLLFQSPISSPNKTLIQTIRSRTSVLCRYQRMKGIETPNISTQDRRSEGRVEMCPTRQTVPLFRTMNLPLKSQGTSRFEPMLQMNGESGFSMPSARFSKLAAVS